MAEFVYNNIKNRNNDHMPMKLNYGYYLYVVFKDEVNFHMKFYSTEKLAKELRELMSIC